MNFSTKIFFIFGLLVGSVQVWGAEETTPDEYLMNQFNTTQPSAYHYLASVNDQPSGVYSIEYIKRLSMPFGTIGPVTLIENYNKCTWWPCSNKTKYLSYCYSNKFLLQPLLDFLLRPITSLPYGQGNDGFIHNPLTSEEFIEKYATKKSLSNMPIKDCFLHNTPNNAQDDPNMIIVLEKCKSFKNNKGKYETNRLKKLSFDENEIEILTYPAYYLAALQSKKMNYIITDSGESDESNNDELKYFGSRIFTIPHLLNDGKTVIEKVITIDYNLRIIEIHTRSSTTKNPSYLIKSNGIIAAAFITAATMYATNTKPQDLIKKFYLAAQAIKSFITNR